MSNNIRGFLYTNRKIIISLLLMLALLLYIFFSTFKNEYHSLEEDIIKNDYSTSYSTKRIFVDVKGCVKKPGVYEMNENDRVVDALKKAELKKSSNTKYINLSKKITDEMVIIVYSNNEINNYLKKKTSVSICSTMVNNACYDSGNNINSVVTKTSNNNIESNLNITSNTSSTSGNKTSNIVNINTASINELTSLTGIGSSKAKSIIEYRNSNGNFETIEDIKKVTGIGESIFEKIKNYITV